jgi:predicted AlkP superfamily pyrophosphatase or phosphodiesterase
MSSPRPRFSFDTPLLVLDIVGLRPKDLADAPRLSALAGEGSTGALETVVPAVTCTVQSSMLTGLLPREHGIVGNGWYFRDLAQVWFWRQANQLVQGRKLYELGREAREDYRCAKLFWWYNMYADVDCSVTPRPQYFANGLKIPGLYSDPPELEAELQSALGAFPLFHFWGPMAGIRSSRWIVDASMRVLEERRPDLALVYLPHLDYDHQRFGPDAPRSREAVREIDAEAGRLIDKARELGMEVLVCSEYGIEDVTEPVFVNRTLRERGYLRAQQTAHGELLDAGASRAFAVVDHQIAHVYVQRERDLPELRQLLEGMPGVARVLDREEQREIELDHERSGELVLLAERGAWFAYPYWLDEAKRPDFATTVDIHRKPGYDPAELFVDPKLGFPKLRVARRLLQKKLGMRYLMDVISTDPGQVRGSHGLMPSSPELGPLYIASPGLKLPGQISASSLLFER